MKRTLLGAASALSILLASAAFAAPADQPGHQSPAPGTNSEPVSAVEDAAAGMVGVVSAEMTSTTKGFVQAAATGDLYEVEADVSRNAAASPPRSRTSPATWSKPIPAPAKS